MNPGTWQGNPGIHGRSRSFRDVPLNMFRAGGIDKHMPNFQSLAKLWPKQENVPPATDELALQDPFMTEVHSFS